MQHWNTLADVPADFGPAAVTMGCFDGVHRGHQALLAHLCRTADDRKVKSAVITFDPLPAQMLRPELAKTNIMSLEDRLMALAAAGVDGVLVLKFRPDVAAQLPEEFAEQVLVGTLKADGSGRR